MKWLLTGYIGLALAVAAFVIGLVQRRVRWLVAGTVIATPIALALALLFFAAPLRLVVDVLIAAALSAWALRRARVRLAGILLLPFAAFVVATALRVPVATDVDGTSAIGVALGDLDADGKLDIVLARGHHAPVPDVVLFNDGQGRFSSQPLSDIADHSFSAGLGDLDGDGDLDVVIGNDSNAPSRVYFNEGRRRFTLAGSFGEANWNSRTVLVVDLDGDGRPDLVAGNRSTPNRQGGTHVCLNDGRGQFPSCRLVLEESASDLAAADVDGDRAVDLVIPHADRGQGYLLLNDGRGGFDQKRPFGPVGLDVAEVALGDLDGDSRSDIVIAERAGRAFAMFNRGSGLFSDAERLGEQTDRLFSVHVTDLNSDGKSDVLLGTAAMQAAVLLNVGDGHTFTRLGLGDRRGVFYGLAGHGIVYGLSSGDLNGDAAPDVVVARAFLPSMVYMNAFASIGKPDSRVSLPWSRLIESR